MKEKARKCTECKLYRCFDCLNLWRFPFWLLLIALMGLGGCDTLFTKPPPEGDDFEMPFDGLSFDLNRTFVLGTRPLRRSSQWKKG